MRRLLNPVVTIHCPAPIPSPPPRTVIEMVVAINDALAQLPMGDELTWFQTRWSQMRPDEQYKWVERRMAPLLIIWTRGGPAGFVGLGQDLDADLHRVDR